MEQTISIMKIIISLNVVRAFYLPDTMVGPHKALSLHNSSSLLPSHFLMRKVMFGEVRQLVCLYTSYQDVIRQLAFHGMVLIYALPVHFTSQDTHGPDLNTHEVFSSSNL